MKLDYENRYQSVIQQLVYQDAVDCLAFGLDFSYLDRHGLSREEVEEIWNSAKHDFMKGENV